MRTQSMSASPGFPDSRGWIPSGKLTKLWKTTIYSGFSNRRWWFSIVPLVYPRVYRFFDCNMMENAGEIWRFSMVFLKGTVFSSKSSKHRSVVLGKTMALGTPITWGTSIWARWDMQNPNRRPLHRGIWHLNNNSNSVRFGVMWVKHGKTMP